MVMPSSGPLSLGGTTSPVSVAAELGLGLTSTISMNQTNVRTLAGVSTVSGTTWSMSSLYGKSNRATASFTYAANTANASLNVAALSGYVAGNTDITITINTGIYVYSTSTATPALSLSGGTTGDTITIVNNGFIMGMGGNGGPVDTGLDGPTNTNTFRSATAGAAGGNALSLGYPVTINNTNPVAYIGGGGGGGGAAYISTDPIGPNTSNAAGGGGAGGGTGGSAIRTGLRTGPSLTRAGGAGGGIGANGSNGAAGSWSPARGPSDSGSAGGGGGRYFPGTNAQTTANPSNFSRGGGANAAGTAVVGTAPTQINSYQGGLGGQGGGAAGGLMSHITTIKLDIGAPYGIIGGGGGGWGASGGTGAGVITPSPGFPTTSALRAGGAGGRAVALNGRTVTWVAGNTSRVYGSVS